MFLPEDYTSPSSNKNYMRILDGENRFRILSAPILGWQDWQDKKPLRYRYNNKPLAPIDPKKPIRHFWAFIVFNYADELIQVLEVTQATVRKSIESLSKDSDWGAPYFYDLKVSRKGEKTDTEYVVTPTPKKALDPYIIEQFNEKPCYLEALFDGADPFDPKWPSYTPGVFSVDSSSSAKLCLSIPQIKAMKDLLYKDQNTDEAQGIILKTCQCASIEEINPERYEKAFAWLKSRVDSQMAVMDVPF